MNPDLPLLLLSNRDEFHARKTEAADFAVDQPILGGIDLSAGGRWLGVTRSGRFAVLTNFREGGQQRDDAPSRGALVENFLAGVQSPLSYAESLIDSAAEYNGYNLLIGDRDNLVYFGNRTADLKPIVLQPGLYGLSNALLDTPWPKVELGKKAVADLSSDWSREAAFELLANKQLADDQDLPSTGIPKAFEKMLSALFIRSPMYGTRASTVISLDQSNFLQFTERSFGALGQQIANKHYEFNICE